MHRIKKNRIELYFEKRPVSRANGRRRNDSHFPFATVLRRRGTRTGSRISFWMWESAASITTVWGARRVERKQYMTTSRFSPGAPKRKQGGVSAECPRIRLGCARARHQIIYEGSVPYCTTVIILSSTSEICMFAAIDDLALRRRYSFH